MPAIRSCRAFRFGDVSTTSQSMIELALQTRDYTPPTNILLDVVNVDLSAFISIDVLDGNFIMVDNISNRLWNRVITSDDLLQIVNEWWVPLIRDQHHLYVHLYVPVLTFYTTQDFRKLHSQFAHPAPVK